MNDDPTQEELLIQSLKIIDEQNVEAAIRLLESHAPSLAAKGYPKVQRELCWKRKTVPAVVALSQAGIRYFLVVGSQSAKAEVGDALRSSAKALAYDLALFTRSGWDEEGVMLMAADVRVGYDTARLNLRPAEELDKPAKAADRRTLDIGGAHQLAAGENQTAADSFRKTSYPLHPVSHSRRTTYHACHGF